MSTIKIYADESVPVAIIAGLRRRDVGATSARDIGNLGLTDEQQLQFAASQKWLLFTHDTDFLALAHQWRLQERLHWGVVYVHQEKLGLGECIRRLKDIVDIFTAEEFQNHIEYL